MRNKITATILLGSALSMQGCGALLGAGAGALAGQAIAGNTAGTLIGAGIGAGSGFLIEEIDKDNKRKIAEAEERGRYEQWREMERRGMTTHRSETRRVLNPDGTVTETGTETVTSEQETSGYTGLPR
tara:strand:+ start:321 stop:704 length:384 start_codon:yes stop_codon:yes gene_type:complete